MRDAGCEMRSSHVLFADLGEEGVLLDTEAGTYYTLDAVGTRAWQLLQERGSLEPVIQVLLQEFDVAEERLRSDVEAFIARLESLGLLR